MIDIWGPLRDLVQRPPRPDEGPEPGKGWPCCTLAAELTTRAALLHDDPRFRRSRPTSEWWEDANIWDRERPWSSNDAAERLAIAAGCPPGEVVTLSREEVGGAAALWAAMAARGVSLWWVQRWDRLTPSGRVPLDGRPNGHTFLVVVGAQGEATTIESTVAGGLKVNGGSWLPDRPRPTKDLQGRLAAPDLDVRATLLSLDIPAPAPAVQVHQPEELTTMQDDIQQIALDPADKRRLLRDLMRELRELFDAAEDDLLDDGTPGATTAAALASGALDLLAAAVQVIGGGPAGALIAALLMRHNDDIVEGVGTALERDEAALVLAIARKHAAASKATASADRMETDGKTEVFERLKIRLARKRADALTADAVRLEARLATADSK